MTTNTRSPERYAETTLGVHAAYENAESLIATLDSRRKVHVQLVGTVRTLRLQQDEHEQTVAQLVRVAYPDLSSMAAFDRKVKDALSTDEKYAELKRDAVQYTNDAETVEAEVRTLELRVKTATARIGQIGDLLRFYAAHTEARTEGRRQAFNPVG
jgi:hypothetical protein